MISSISALRAFSYDLAAERLPRSQAAEPKAADQSAAGTGQLSEEERAQVEELKRRDREVRAHEQAHMAAGAGLITRGASFTYKRGPDGQQYAIGGEVGIDVSAVPGDPAATIRKAEQVRSAALAPASPSGQDRAVAAAAAQMAAEARQQQAQQTDSAAGPAAANGATEAARPAGAAASTEAARPATGLGRAPAEAESTAGQRPQAQRAYRQAPAAASGASTFSIAA